METIIVYNECVLMNIFEEPVENSYNDHVLHLLVWLRLHCLSNGEAKGKRGKKTTCPWYQLGPKLFLGSVTSFPHLPPS